MGCSAKASAVFTQAREQYLLLDVSFWGLWEQDNFAAKVRDVANAATI